MECTANMYGKVSVQREGILQFILKYTHSGGINLFKRMCSWLVLVKPEHVKGPPLMVVSLIKSVIQNLKKKNVCLDQIKY